MNQHRPTQCLKKQQDGFSSDEPEQQQIIYAHQESRKLEELPNHEDHKIKLNNQSIRDLVSKTYSLEPDMINGWTPKVEFARPVPLSFYNQQFDYMIQNGIKSKKLLNSQKQQCQEEQHAQLCYLGPRYETTYYAWYDKEFQFPYNHLSHPKNISFTDREFVGQHWDAEKPPFLQFNSLYESGNLDCAIKISQFQYDLFMRIDSNTRGHLQWFNFKVKGLMPGSKYRFNICNFQKAKNLYLRGMRPYCYSVKKYQNQGIGWHQVDGEVKYRKKISKTQKLLQFQSYQNKYLQLTFQITTSYQQDQLQLSYCIPYTYSSLKKYLSQISEQSSSKTYLSIKKLCNSLGGHVVDEITITQNVEEEQNCFKKKVKLNKRVIFITGRCHPGETNGSWMVEGLIQFLIGGCSVAQFMRKYAIFKIVPMLNPDGVILGNYRTGLFGKDFNRQFHCPDKDIFPEVFHLKQMFWAYKQIYKEHAFIYLDFHGHSVKKNVFAYGPEYPISHRNYYQSRMIPKLIAHKSKMFRYHSCIFKIAESKQSTGRAIFLKSHKIPFTFTIEASNGAYYDQEKGENYDFDQNKWKQVGYKVIEGIYQYFKLILELERIRNQKLRERKEIIMRNRERAKAKKIKNSKMGYFTSMGFRKSKTSANEEIQITQLTDNIDSPLAISDLIKEMKIFQGSENITQILQQIKKDQNGSLEEKKKFSDDQISQGKSDSEGSKDDIDLEYQKQLMSVIKQKKRKKKIQKRVQSSLQRKQTNTIKKIFQTQPDLQEQEPICKQNTKTSSKQILVRKYLWKKKNSAFSSVSPKRQDQNSSIAAKIVNFNFSLNPIECTITQANQSKAQHTANSSTTAFNSTYYSFSNGNKSNSNCMNLKNEEKGRYNDMMSQKKAQRGYQYSEAFKKTFISVQKQIIRRDSQKRYLVSLNNYQNQNKQKNNWLVENVRGKKIVATPQEQIHQMQTLTITNRQIEHKSESPQKIKTEIKSPERGDKNCYKLSTKLSKGQNTSSMKQRKSETENISVETQKMDVIESEKLRKYSKQAKLKQRQQQQNYLYFKNNGNLTDKSKKCQKQEYKIEQL